ncbi:hypothetical protein, unknown function [Leishmania tarentolae]|uniref:Uncharacterized protein n=1 Tax=Leishmania tarentolae TaxID=5689 RepID=A0A640KG99_LEITA|nr:hypothetical protein, unknown function [Leishmania tarentolae]
MCALYNAARLSPSAIPLMQSPPHTPPASDSGGNKEAGAAQNCTEPEQMLWIRPCSSPRASSATTSDSDTSAATSEGVGADGEAEILDAEKTVMAPTQDHALPLRQPPCSIHISDFSSSLLRRRLTSLFSGSTSRAARGDTSSSRGTPGLRPLFFQASTPTEPGVHGKLANTISSCQSLERQRRENMRSNVAVNRDATRTRTAAGTSTLTLSRSSVQGRSVSSVGYRLCGTCFLFWADAAAFFATSSMLLRSPIGSAIAPLPLSSSTQPRHEDVPHASIEMVAAHVETENWSESATAAATSSMPQAREAAGNGCSDALPHQRMSSDEKDSSSIAKEVAAKQAQSLSVRDVARACSTLSTGCILAEDNFRREILTQHAGGDESGSPDRMLFHAATPSVHHALPAASDAERNCRQSEKVDHLGGPHHVGVCSRDNKPKDATQNYMTNEQRPRRHHSNDFHGTARSRNGDGPCITMSSLVAHVAVPPTVQAVLRNAEATKEELWMALRTACQQCEVLQRRLARAEGALGNEEEGDAGATSEGRAPSHITVHRRRRSGKDHASRRLSRRYKDDEASNAPTAGDAVEGAREAENCITGEHATPAQMPSSTAPLIPTQVSRQVRLRHRAQRRIAERAAAASSTPPILARAQCHGSANAAYSDTHCRQRGGASEASLALRNRVSEVIRRVEAKRKAPLHPPHTQQLPETHTRSNNSERLHVCTSTPPHPEGRGISHCTFSSNLQANGTGRVRVEYGTPRTVELGAGPTVHDPQSPAHMEGGSSCGGSDAVAAPLHVSSNKVANCESERADRGESGILVSDMLPATTMVEAQAPVAQQSYYPTERVQVVQSPPPPPPQQQPHHHHGSDHLASFDTSLAVLDESVHLKGCAAVGESLATLQSAATFKPANLLSNGRKSSGSSWRSLSFHSLSPLAVGSPTIPSTRVHQSEWAALTSANGAPTTLIANLVTPLNCALPSLHPAPLFRCLDSLRGPLHSEAGIAPAQSAWARQQEQQQHAKVKVTPSRVAAGARVSVEARQQRCCSSPPSSNPHKVALLTASATLEMLRQLQQEDAPVPPVTGDDQKAALRQWRREAAVMKGSRASSMC